MKTNKFCYEIATIKPFRNVLERFYSDTELLLSDLKALRVEAEKMFKCDVRIDIYETFSNHSLNMITVSDETHYQTLHHVGYLDTNKNEIHYI